MFFLLFFFFLLFTIYLFFYISHKLLIFVHFQHRMTPWGGIAAVGLYARWWVRVFCNQNKYHLLYSFIMGMYFFFVGFWFLFSLSLSLLLYISLSIYFRCWLHRRTSFDWKNVTCDLHLFFSYLLITHQTIQKCAYVHGFDWKEMLWSLFFLFPSLSLAGSHLEVCVTNLCHFRNAEFC